MVSFYVIFVEYQIAGAALFFIKEKYITTLLSFVSAHIVRLDSDMFVWFKTQQKVCFCCFLHENQK